MSFTLSSLAANFIFGVIGLFLVRRAKTEANLWSGLTGLTLMVYGYFLSNDFALWGTGVALCVAAYVTRDA